MRIALDFDGVIHDITAVKQRHAREAHGLELGRADVWRPLVLDHLTEEQHVGLVQVAHTTVLEGAEHAVEGALAGILGLAREHDLYVVTARNDDEIPFAREWLRAQGVPLRQIRHTRRQSKLDYCLALGVTLLLDDLPYVLRDVAGTSVQPVLLETPYNRTQELPAGTETVADWSAFIELCARLASREPLAV
jgi:uncharacterized HAD superfamily protein